MKKIALVLVIIMVASFYALTPTTELVGTNEEGHSVYYDPEKVTLYSNSPIGAEVVLILKDGDDEVDHYSVDFYKVEGKWKYIPTGKVGMLEDALPGTWSGNVADKIQERLRRGGI